MKKFLSLLLVLIVLVYNTFFITSALPTNNLSSPWTREKAEHLAKAVLFSADARMIDDLYSAGSAARAVDILFPSREGPDRTEFKNYLTAYTSSGFNWADANHTTRLYQIVYGADPYEAKRKLFSLFEDIFSVNNDSGKDITFKDISDLHTLIYDNMFGDYQLLVKKVLYNNGGRGDYALGAFLDLFNQNDPAKPNENYARELLQLFLMGEYKPHESKDNGDVRNYEESDVLALAKILTGLRSVPTSHVLYFDSTNHYVANQISFLTGSMSETFPYYNTSSGLIDPVSIVAPVNANNGLTDNVIEYIFAKRSDAIALFLADRIVRFYIEDKPSRDKLDYVAAIIKSNNFDIYNSVKSILTLDMMYSETSMNSIRYKNPLELSIGTIRFMRNNAFTGIIIDPNLIDTNLLRRLGWTPYFPGSIFGRDGFDNSIKWSSTSTLSSWMSATNMFTYRVNGTGVVDFLSILGNQKKEITTEVIGVMTHANNSYSGVLTIISGSLDLGDPIVTGVSQARIAQFSFLDENLSIEEQIVKNGYPLDPVVAIEGGENLNFITSEITSFTPALPIPDEPGMNEEAPIQSVEISIGDSVNNPGNTGSESLIIPVIESESMTGSSVMSTEIESGGTISGSVEVTERSKILSMVQEVQEASTEVTGQNILSGTLPEEGIPSGSGEVVAVSEVSILSEENTRSLSGMTETGEVINTEQLIGKVDFIDSTGSGIGVQTGGILNLSNTGNTIPDSLSGKIDNLPQLEAVTMVSNLTGSVTLPSFRINTNLGAITLGSGSYDGQKKILTVFSGTLLQASGAILPIYSGVFQFSSESRLIADTITPDMIISNYEQYIYGDSRIPTDARVFMRDFITHDGSGALIPVAPSNAVYFNKYIRGLLSIMLSQPEYVLLRGYDIPIIENPNETKFLDSIKGKIFFIELYGGNDYMTSIIPKDEYSTYLDYRSNSSGSIAISGTGLVDIGNFYMNSALAYGNSGATGFKDLYDQGYLKIFNRVGGYKHSNDHDAAAKQISSYDSTTSAFSEGVFGHLVKNELESSHTISLGAKLPNVYRAGHYVNLGGNIILTNPLDSGGQWKSHMDTMVTITKNRVYPADTRNLFQDAGKISEIGKISVAQGGAPGASGDMNSVFNFAKVLINNNIGRTFYMGGAGGYDTHGNQFTGLNQNLRTVGSAVTKFFNDVKDTQDVTIIIFSEFGRTNKTNGDLGTDHGDGGGMFVLTSNTDLRQRLSEGTYGNMSIKFAKNNSLGVGIDYRSIYGSIFQSIYGLSPISYFGTNIDLNRDISLEKSKVQLLSYSYQASGQNVILNGEFTISGSNYDPGKAGYTRLVTHTGSSNLKITRLSEKYTPEGFKYTFQANQTSSPYFTIESFSNQYALSSFSGNLVDATRPIILGSNVRHISQSQSSILPIFSNIQAPVKLSGSGVILESTGNTIVTLSGSSLLALHFASGITHVTDLTTTSGSLAWKGGFILGEKVDRDLFIPDNATIVSENKILQRESIISLIKIGADVRGIGMNLNQPIGLEFRSLIPKENYRVLTSQDGISWDDVESGKSYTGSTNGSIYVETSHFSYFAVVLANGIIESIPTCTISASPVSVFNGSGTTLSWAIQNTLTGTLSPLNSIIGTGGFLNVIPPNNATTRYTIQVSNSAGVNSCSVSVTSMDVPPPPPDSPGCFITASPTTVQNGSSSIISWTLINTQSGVLNPGNLSVGMTGSFSYTPPVNSSTTFGIDVRNSTGSGFCSVVVKSNTENTNPVVPNVPNIGPGGPSGLPDSSSCPIGLHLCDKSNGLISHQSSQSGYTDVIPVQDSIFGTMNYIIQKWENGSVRLISPGPSVLSKEIMNHLQNGVTGKITSLGNVIDYLRMQKIGKKSQTQRAINRTILEIQTNSSRGQIAALHEKTPEVTDFESKNPEVLSRVPIESMGFVPTKGQFYVAAESSLRLHTTPVVSDLNIIDYLPRNTRVELLETNGDWANVKFGSQEGYVRQSFLRELKLEDRIRSGEVDFSLGEHKKIDVKQSLFIREKQSTTSSIRGVLFRDDVVVILDRVGKWVEILTDKYHGFINKKYLVE
ncbi:MAG: hypothetical protein HHAS10_02880 [Candidatus Altimarinota bacterium]